MKKFIVLCVALGAVACGQASSPSQPYRSCTSNVHCSSDEVCFSYNVSSPPGQPWREGYCGKLSATR